MKRFSDAQPKPPLDEGEKVLMGRLRGHVEMLSEVIGQRNTDRPGGLEAAARYIEDTVGKLGYTAGRQEYRAGGQTVRNLEVEIAGSGRRNREIVILGAHYDSVDCPAANDNGSGVAGVLEAARLWAGKGFSRTVRRVFFGVRSTNHIFNLTAGGVKMLPFDQRRCSWRRRQVGSSRGKRCGGRWCGDMLGAGCRFERIVQSTA